MTLNANNQDGTAARQAEPRDEQNSRAIAMAATGGEWVTVEGTPYVCPAGDLAKIIALVMCPIMDDEEQRQANAAFIAHFKPVRVLQLLDELAGWENSGSVSAEAFSEQIRRAQAAETRVLSMLEEIERLRGALEGAHAKMEVALSCMESSGHLHNKHRILSDAGLWITRAQSEARAALSDLGEGDKASVADSARALRGAHTDAAEVGKGGGS